VITHVMQSSPLSLDHVSACVTDAEKECACSYTSTAEAMVLTTFGTYAITWDSVLFAIQMKV